MTKWKRVGEWETFEEADSVRWRLYDAGAKEVRVRQCGEGGSKYAVKVPETTDDGLVSKALGDAP